MRGKRSTGPAHFRPSDSLASPAVPTTHACASAGDSAACSSAHADPTMSVLRPLLSHPPRLPSVRSVPKRVVRDPRFESLSGKLEEDKFRHRYAFLYDEVMIG